MDIVSSCLAGIKCRYNGKASENEAIMRMYEEGKVVPICPECLAGLAIPRCPSEITGGDGKDVLNGNAKVIGKDGSDRTQEFIEGAEKTLGIVRECGAKRAYLKAKSPSCGLNAIYDGTFEGKLIKGCGVTAALLIENGIEIIEV